jgi:ABC-type uncharacterized transport system auxiliary subunit
MKPKPKCMVNVSLIGLVCVLISGSGCNRATMRIPGASGDFPETATHYTTATKLPYTLVVATPSDHRKEHERERVACTKWKSASTDAMWSTDTAKMFQERLVKELKSSGMFLQVTNRPPKPEDLVLKTEIDVFSSQARGFLFVRVVGMSALRVSLERKGKTLLEQKFERVVTDADKEYTGSQVSFIEQAMRVTMADSLRELMKDMLKEIDAKAAVWPKDPAANK